MPVKLSGWKTEQSSGGTYRMQQSKKSCSLSNQVRLSIPIGQTNVSTCITDTDSAKNDTAISSQSPARKMQGGHKQLDCQTKRPVAEPATPLCSAIRVCSPLTRFVARSCFADLEIVRFDLAMRKVVPQRDYKYKEGDISVYDDRFTLVVCEGHTTRLLGERRR